MKRIILLIVLVTLPVLALAQPSTISGRVVGDDGEPVVGAVVRYDGTNESTITDMNGRYSIKHISGKDLIFSCLGYRDYSLKVTRGSVSGDVTMKVDVTGLDEAIVIGYGETSKRDLTEAIVSVKADEIRKAGKGDVLSSLQGHVAGLNITTQTGEPGSGYGISIRGINSVNAGTTPLFVVDGVQMDITENEGAASLLGSGTNDPLAFLNPSDIQSVEVLKDASATAIYGARGANGVILITTKSGIENAGKTAVTYDGRLSVTTRMTEREPQMLSPQEWINYRYERHDQMYELFGEDGKPYSVEQFGREQMDWREKMFRNAFLHQHNVSIRSSFGKDTQILGSLGYLGQQGLIVNNNYGKFTAQLKLDHGISKRLKVGASANFARTKSTGAASSTSGSFTNFGLTQLIFTERPLAYFEDPSDAEGSITSQTSIYDCVTAETSRTGIANKMIGNTYLNWKIMPDLTFRIYASGMVADGSDNEFYSSKTRWGHKSNGLATIITNKTVSFTGNSTLTYNKRWLKAHGFSAMMGVEMNSYTYDYYRQQASDFDDDSLREMALAKGNQISNPVQNKSTSRRMSAFGRITYNYKYRYFTTFNVRADGSSKFSAGNRVGYFPSMSFAWVPSNEKWAAKAKRSWLDNAKLRGSIGISGNDRISNYANLSTLDKLFYSTAEGAQALGMAENTSGNSKLSWETTYQYDLGIDFGALNGRIDFTFDVYYKDTRDMLFKAVIPSQSGFTTQWQNVGSILNKGFELALNTVNVKHKDFSWSTDIVFDLNRNRITSLGDGVEYISNKVAKGSFAEEPTRLIKGEPVGVIWGYEWDGNYQLSDFVFTYKDTGMPVPSRLVTEENYNLFNSELKEGVPAFNGVTVRPGDRKFKDLDGDGIIKEDTDKKMIGNCYPKFTYGIGNTFSWKGLCLYIFFDGVYGRDILNEFKLRTEAGASTGMYNITSAAYYDAWRPGNGSNSYSRLTQPASIQNTVSSFYVEDASFLRLKTLSLSYALPSKLCRRICAQSLKFTVSADNVCIFTPYSGLDPEKSSSSVLFPGIDTMTYPTGRSFTLGIIAIF